MNGGASVPSFALNKRNAIIALYQSRVDRRDIPKKFGLMWEEIGRQPPAQGRLLENKKLAEELQSTSAFVQDAWDIFNIKDLKI